MRKRAAMENKDIRAALDRHWAASDANNFDEEHQIYREDAVLEYPQSGERIRGRPQHSGISFRAAKQKALHCTADTRYCRPVGHWFRPYLRWAAVLLGEHNGVQRWEGSPRDPVLWRSVRARAFAGSMGRTDALSVRFETEARNTEPYPSTRTRCRLELTEANRAIQAALAKAHNLAVKISVAVCDADGRLVALQRMDGA